MLEALARVAWAEAHNAECPNEQIPTEADLCGWTWKIPEEDKAKAADHVAAFLPPLDSYDYHDGDPRANRWQWIQVADPAGPTEPNRLVVALIDGNGVTGRVAFTASILDEKTGELVEAPLILSLEQMQTTWCKVHRDRLPPHPLAPLVRAWQARPKPADPFRPKNKASLPALQRKPKEPDQLQLIETPYLIGPPPGQQLALGWLLNTYRRAGGPDKRPGRGGQWDLHLMVGVLLYTDIADRDGQWHSFEIPTEELIQWLHPHPNGWTNRGRDWERLPAALYELNKLGWIEIEGVGLVQVVNASVIPLTPKDPYAQFIVRIPSAAAHGARID